MKGIFFYILLLLLSACSIMSENILVKQKLTNNICLAQDAYAYVNYGIWSLKTNPVDIPLSETDSWSLIFRDPTHIAYNNDYVLGKSGKNKYIIVKLKEGKLERYYIERDTAKFIAKRKEFNVPDSLVLSPIKK